MTERKRPNFLLITTDQQRGDAFGFEGRRVHTPFLDRMAETGTRFSSCITPNPVCQPARASMLTGLLPNTHGVSDNGIDLEPSLGERGFAGALSASGYRTALIGKAHFATSHTFEPTGTPECRFSMERFGEDWHGPYMGFDHVELVVEGHNVHLPLAPPNGQHYERYYHRDGRGPHWDRMHGQNGREVAGDPPQTWHSCLPPAMHNSTWVADRTIAQLAETSHDRPFCIWASFPDPHHPFDCPLPWSLLHSPEDVDLPAERTLDLDRRPWWHRATLELETRSCTTVFRHVARGIHSWFFDSRPVAIIRSGCKRPREVIRLSAMCNTAPRGSSARLATTNERARSRCLPDAFRSATR